ncbi:MAG: hypothetical protein HY791_14715, partial [Deltaproteobacteria bacterium]|nr:hypothetical protein [Deltaproteobacteria bacterium]
MNLVVANAKGRNIARGSLGSTTWVWALSRFGRISTRILAPALYASACTFSPPALQSPSQDVGGPGEDAATPDAHPDAPDAVALDASEDRDAGFEQDATDPDVGTPDLGSPDLGTPDLGVRDTGVDVGFPDTGACPPVGATPALVARAQVTHGLDQAVLVDDLDDDGIDELVVSSRADGRFSVLAPGADCTFGVATAAASLPVGGPLVAEPQSLLVTANATGLEAFSYDVQGGLSSVLTLPLGDRIDAAASSPTGTFFVATGFDGGNTGFFGLDEQNQPGWTEYGSNPLARPAYFSFPSSA